MACCLWCIHPGQRRSTHDSGDVWVDIRGLVGWVSERLVTCDVVAVSGANPLPCRASRAGVPKWFEWYGAFSLMVSRPFAGLCMAL